MSLPILLGHRGARSRAPENTMASLRRALRDGADGFEFDVRVTRDGLPVLLHDETVDRTTDAFGRVGSFDRRDLDALDASAHWAADLPRERIPTLDEVLEEFLGNVEMAMELKEPLPAAAWESLARRLRRLDAPRFLVASFRPDALAPAPEVLPSIPRALILRRDQPLPARRETEELSLDVIFAREENVDARFVSASRRDGLALYAYTVNSAARARELAALGVDGIISDDPAAIRPALPARE